MKRLIVSLFILITISFAGVIVNGYAYLEDQTDHSDIMILFQNTVLSDPSDTNYTNTDGYYSMEINTGLYNVIFSKEEYLNVELVDQQVYSDTTLETVTLVRLVNISGYVLLENQTDFSGVQIAFERTSPSVFLDTAYTESSGYFSIDIQAGIYDINYYKEGFFNWTLNDQNFSSTAVLDTLILPELTTLLNVPAVFPNIQYAIDASNDGDTVLVASGTYVENINFNGHNISLCSNFITTQDTSYISQTIIDGSNSNNTFSVNNGSGSLKGFTIINGSGEYGGGVEIIFSDFELSDLIVRNNTCGAGGGAGIYGFQSNLDISNVLMHNNTSGDVGGGFYFKNNCIVNINNCQIFNNQAQSSGGGGFSRDTCLININNTVINNNIAVNGRGGGLYFYYAEALLNRVSLVNNISNTQGSAIRLNESQSFQLLNSVIYGNQGNNSGHPTIAVISQSGPIFIINSVIKYNVGQSTYDYSTGVISNSFLEEDDIISMDTSYIYFGDPLFVLPDLGNFDLLYNSPCIDNGAQLLILDGDTILNIPDNEYIGSAPDIGIRELDPDSYIYPLAAFDANVYEGQVPLPVQFTHLATSIVAPLVSFSWNFGDGATSDGQNPVHLYTTTGTYDVQLSVIDSLGFSDTKIKHDFITVVYEMGIETELIPTVYALKDNYPNPFNPRTTLKYDLPEQAHVNIDIYDMLGRQVKTLMDQTQDAGYRSVIWDATNDYGKPVSAGIYLYQIQAGEYMQTKKMVLLK